MADQSLNDMMSEASVIRVMPDGEIIYDRTVYAPDVYVTTDDDGQIMDDDDKAMIDMVKSAGWEMLNGFSGQYLYAGPIMHPSEYIGGGMEEHIRTNPGYYASVIVTTLGLGCVNDDDQCDPDSPCDACTEAKRERNGEDAGWAVVFREAPDAETSGAE